MVEEALRSRGVLAKSLSDNGFNEINLINETFTKEQFSKNNKSKSNSDVYILNKKSFSDNVKMMHEYIEFKYFKKLMSENKNILE